MSVVEIELDEDLYAELLDLSDVEGVTVDELVRDMIVEGLDNRADIRIDDDDEDDDEYGELDF